MSIYSMTSVKRYAIFSHCNNINNIAGIVFITMQLCVKDKILICYQLCQAVMFLHTNEPQMAHLDIKPANILVIDFCIRIYAC